MPYFLTETDLASNHRRISIIQRVGTKQKTIETAKVRYSSKANSKYRLVCDAMRRECQELNQPAQQPYKLIVDMNDEMITVWVTKFEECFFTMRYNADRSKTIVDHISQQVDAANDAYENGILFQFSFIPS